MINIIDIIGIVIVLVSALIAFKNGFVKTFFSFISTFVALILAFALCNTGVQIIKNNTGIDEWLNTTLTEAVNKNDQTTESENVSEDQENNKTSITAVLGGLPENIKEMAGIEEYKENAKNTIIETSIEIILKILSWVIIYIVVRLALMIICFVFNGIMSIPILKQINNLAGLGIGAILGLFRVYVILAFISFLASVISMDAVISLIKNSAILSVMYDNNILLSLIF